MLKPIKLILITSFALPICAQKNVMNQKHKGSASIVRKYSDSLATIVRKYDNWKYQGADTLSNPYYFRLFFQPTYYSDPIKRKMEANWAESDSVNWKPAKLYSETSKEDEQLVYMDDALISLYTENPEFVRISEKEFMKKEGVKANFEKKIEHEVTFSDKVEPSDVVLFPEGLNIVVHKPNFWTFSGNFSLQFTQNYLSDNWYKGGESTNSLLTACTLRAIYNNKQKVKFENTLEMKLGFQSSRNDNTHDYKTYSDQIRLTNKLGLQATKHWYYTLLLQSWTQFYPGYRSNDEWVYSDFMSPFESVFSIGMDYQLSIKRFSVSANVAPLAYDFKYVDRRKLTSAYNVHSQSKTRGVFGSNITVNYNWQIMNNVSWGGRIYYFSDYKLSKIEWENTFNLKINKYLTSQLFLYPRFDDSGTKGDDGYLQFKEWLSLGLSLSF